MCHLHPELLSRSEIFWRQIIFRVRHWIIFTAVSVSSRSSSAEINAISFCGEPNDSPNCVSLSCSTLITAGFPPLNLARNVEREWIRSLGPKPKADRRLKAGTYIITSASELAISKSLDSYLGFSNVMQQYSVIENVLPFLGHGPPDLTSKKWLTH